MRLFSNYRLEKNDTGHTLVIYLDYSAEFATELVQSNEKQPNASILGRVNQFVIDYFPNIKINTVRFLVGTTLVLTLSLSPVLAAGSSYTVKSGDSLWVIANQNGISIQQLKEYNQLKSDTIYVGQVLSIPPKEEASGDTNIRVVVSGKEQSFEPSPILVDGTTYLPVRPLAESLGASVWYNSSSQTIGINKDNLQIAFIVGSTTARVNGIAMETLPSISANNATYVPVRFVSEALGMDVNWNGTDKTLFIAEPTDSEYTVVSGDSLWKIADRFNTTIPALMTANNLSTDLLFIGQKLTIPNNPSEPKQEEAVPTISYIEHVVKQGDIIWNLSIQYGIPMTELLSTNGLTTNSMLTVGQVLKIPVHNIPIKPVVSSNYGELLDWWTEAQYVLPIGKVAKVIDFQTGKEWYIKRTIGANHSDTEPLTAEDSAIIKEVWGGTYSWKSRPIIVEVDGRRLAASMASMPHDIQYITDNNFNGHFDLYFLNSTRHVDGKLDLTHQENVKIAAGVSGL